MTSTGRLKKTVEQQNRLRILIVKAIELICREGRFGFWEDARTTASSVWALCECGLAKSHPEYIRSCLDQLLDSEECITDEDGMCLNREVWDTSVALIALRKGNPSEFRNAIDSIVDWLLAEASYDKDNFKCEPWETLWAIYSLMTSGVPTSRISLLVKRCISWLLNRRNLDGVLISPHYTGFLLSVLNSTLTRFDLSEDERSAYNDVTSESLAYLMREFERERRRRRLWNNEPWLIGHVLLGITDCTGQAAEVFDDINFNEYLVNWYERGWKDGQGWIDVLDTACTMIGLSNYYIKRELHLRGDGELAEADVLSELTSLVRFRFTKRDLQRMVVWPLWKGRKFKIDKRLCFVLMPFREKWSSRIYRIIANTLREYGFTAVRADEIYRPEVMEDIWRGINEASVVIAECTGMNTNVFYELGIAHTIGKDVIILTQDKKYIPFDVHGIRYIEYKDTDDGYRRLKDRLPKHVDACLKGR